MVDSWDEARASLGFLRANRGEICRFTLSENYWGGESTGWFSEFKFRLDSAASGLIADWDGHICVRESETWSCLLKDYFLFGRGGSVFSLPISCLARAGPDGVEWVDDRVFESLLVSLAESEWKDWVSWREYIVEDGLFVGEVVQEVV